MPSDGLSDATSPAEATGRVLVVDDDVTVRDVVRRYLERAGYHCTEN